MSRDPNDFLDGGGYPTVSFEVGTLVKGEILDLTVQQQRDFATGLPKTWPDGNPMEQLVIAIQTDLRDPSIEDDDGKRRIFIDNKRKREAVAAAKKASGAKLARGGMIAMKCTGEEPSKTPGFRAAKTYVAQYRPPTADGAANDLLDSSSTPVQPVASDLLGNGAVPPAAASVL